MDYQTKTDKTTRVLMLYHRLLNGQYIDKITFSLDHGINERTFDRDIEDVRLFLSDSFSASELVFDKETCSYYLTGDKPKYLDRMDAVIIGKILLSGNALRQDEADGLLHALFSAVAPNDARAIREYLKQSMNCYTSKTDAALLKSLGDLYVVIHSGMDIEIALQEDEATVVKQISPLEIEIVDSVFYLVGAEDRNLSHVIHYRIDKIEQFHTLRSTFARALQEKYIDKETKEHG
jgi:predicted DNA-binding transcriptional regulator YafY